jgi:hypothetical protein
LQCCAGVLACGESWRSPDQWPGGLWPAQGNWLNWQGNPPAQWPEIDYMSIFNGDTVTIRVGEAPVGDGCVYVLGELAAKPRGGRG